MKSQPPNQGFLSAEEEIRSLLCHWTMGGKDSLFYLIFSMYIWRDMPPDEYDT